MPQTIVMHQAKTIYQGGTMGFQVQRATGTTDFYAEHKALQLPVTNAEKTALESLASRSKTSSSEVIRQLLEWSADKKLNFESVNFWVSKPKYAAYRLQAKTAGLSVNVYLRQLLTDGLAELPKRTG